MAYDTEQLKADMEARIVFRGRWFEEEYQPDLHGNPYAIIAKDVVEVAAAHLIKKHISDFFTPAERAFGGGGMTSVTSIAKKIGVDPRDLIALLNSETASDRKIWENGEREPPRSRRASTAVHLFI